MSALPKEFHWILCYGPDALRRNYDVIKHICEKFGEPPPKIFAVTGERYTACIVVTQVPLTAIKNPHVTEWLDHFEEVTIEKAMQLAHRGFSAPTTPTESDKG